MRKKYALALMLVVLLSLGVVVPLITITGDDMQEYERNQIVCMRDQLLERIAISDERFEMRRNGCPYGRMLMNSFLEEKQDELDRQRMLLSQLDILTQIYRNPDFPMSPDALIQLSIELGHIECIDAFNYRRANYILPDNFPYFTITLPASDWLWDFFKVSVSHEPTQGCIDFILNFTGIPREMLYVVKGGIVHDYIPYDQIPVRDNFPGLEYEEPREYELPTCTYFEIEPYSATWTMGMPILVSGVGRFTLGHPANASGDIFVTSLHRPGLTGTAVFCDRTGLLIGTIINSHVDGFVDVAHVRVTSGRVSTTGITSFRGEARRDDRVSSLRAITGTQTGQVIATGGGVMGSVREGMAVMPDIDTSASGDSGAALLRTGGVVLGTRIGVDRLSGWRIGIYSNIMHY